MANNINLFSFQASNYSFEYQSACREEDAKLAAKILKINESSCAQKPKKIFHKIRPLSKLASGVFSVVKPLGKLVNHPHIQKIQTLVGRCFSLIGFFYAASDLYQAVKSGIRTVKIQSLSHFYKAACDSFIGSLLVLNSIFNGTLAINEFLPLLSATHALSLGSFSFFLLLFVLSLIAIRSLYNISQSQKAYNQLRDILQDQTLTPDERLEKYIQHFDSELQKIKKRDLREINYQKVDINEVEFLLESRYEEMRKIYGPKALELILSVKKHGYECQEMDPSARLQALSKMREAQDELKALLIFKYLQITGLLLLILALTLLHFVPPAAIACYVLFGITSVLFLTQNVYDWIANDEKEKKAVLTQKGKELLLLRSAIDPFTAALTYQIEKETLLQNPDLFQRELLESRLLQAHFKKFKKTWKKSLSRQEKKLSEQIDKLSIERFQQALIKQFLKIQEERNLQLHLPVA